MSDVNAAPDVTPIADVVPAPASDTHSARDLSNYLTDFRNKRDAEPKEQPEAPAKAAEPEPEAPPVEEPGETQTKEAEPAEEPPIEPPRSWTKEEKEEFSTYPREAQEKIARREQDRETALRRGQNETAEQRKAIEAERSKVEQARQQYESALPALLQTLNAQQQGEFADIKTMEDVTKLAKDDWPRYALWDAQQKKIAAVQQEVTAAQERQAQDYKTKWADFATREDAKFLELAPEMADTTKATKLADGAKSLLKEIGFTEQDLTKLWLGDASLSLRDHRAQLLIRDAVRYRDAQAAVKKAVAKPIPKVQRPGTSQARATDDDVNIKGLEQRLNQSANWKDAAALIAARRANRG